MDSHCAIIPANNRDFTKKKKRGPIHLFRVALHMLKQTKRKKNHVADVKVDSSSLWQSVLGSMRPFHAHNHPTPPQLTEPPVTGFPSTPLSEHMELFTPPMSPAPRDNMSQYASALNLQDLDRDHDDDDDDCGFNGDKDGDDMIDDKAEQFIAEFYQQIKVQNQAYNHHRNKRVK